jgi:hypothetical protein
MRSDIVSGGISHTTELPDHTGKLCKLSDLHGDHPLANPFVLALNCHSL